MSRDRMFHPVPRGGIDPIRCAEDALAVLALAAPYGHDTIVILLDAERRGTSVTVVTDTIDRDALFRVIGICVAATQPDSTIEAMIVASSRPDGDVEPDDVHRWLEASDQCRGAGSNWSNGSYSGDRARNAHASCSASPSAGRHDRRRHPPERARRSAGLRRRPAARRRRTSSRLSIWTAPAATRPSRYSSGMS